MKEKMKDLTHYFNSPKEENADSQNVNVLPEQVTDTVKKLRVFRRDHPKKSDNYVNTNGNLNSSTLSDTDISTSNSVKKKRKIEIEDIQGSKKIKIVKSSKDDGKTSATKLNKSNNTLTRPSKSDCKDNHLEKENKTKNQSLENKLHSSKNDENSCENDGPWVPVKKRKRLKLLLDDSEDELLLEEKESPTVLNNSSTENSLNNSDKSSGSGRNSLFSYFSKVDKETAFVKKSEKIKVEALIHLPPNGDNKPTRRSSTGKPLNIKSKKSTKKQLDNSDCIEVIGTEFIVVDENSSGSINMQASPNSENKEKNNKFLTKEESASKTPSRGPNLASIFIPKKLDKDEVIERKSSVQNDSNTPEQKNKGLEENKTKKQKKSLKINKDHNSVDSTTNGGIVEDNKDQKESNKQELKTTSKSKTLKNKCYKKNSVVGIKKPSSSKTTTSTNESKEDKVIQSNKEELVINIDNDSNKSKTKICIKTTGKTSNKTPENIPTSQCNKDPITPKNKTLTLNGFFTQKGVVEKHSEEKSSKKTSSPWVMKVRINSATKSVKDSDEDSRDSVQEVKQDKPADKSKAFPKDEKDDDIVLLEDDDNSSASSQEIIGKRKSIPRNAKQPKPLPADDSDTESPKPSVKLWPFFQKGGSKQEIVLLDDDDNSSASSQEIIGKRKSIPRNAKQPKPLPTDDSESESPKPSVKMWPFFQKGGAKRRKDPPIDPEKLRARQLFLESGVPDIIKRKVEIEKSEASVGNPAPFPMISHVTQLQSSSCVEETKFPLPPSRCSSPPAKLPQWSAIISSKDPEESEIPVFERPGNVKAVLEKIKEEEPKTDVKALYKKLKEYKINAESDIWTDVYKPTKSADMVGNSESIKKLKSWMETLKNQRKLDNSGSSGDEFVADDSDGESSSTNNLAIISGPCGCGKTCAVYAIAAELDCKVLEMNASCNRSGKRILAEFSESTQSHQVERAQPLNGLFNNQGSGKKKKKKSKRSKETKSEKTSLILVEDADLLFADTDEGFMAALSSLAATAKRPLILVTNRTRNPHLDRFQSCRPLYLSFDKPKAAKLSLWLRLVGLVEGVVVTADLANHLVEWSGRDVRKALLQLQLMVHSNNSEIKENQTESDLWWRWPATHRLTFELPTLLEPEETTAVVETDKQLIRKQLETMARTTSGLALLDILSAKESWQVDPCQLAWRASWTDSTSLEPCKESELSGTVRQDLTTWLAQAVANRQSNCDRVGQTAQEARWLSILRQGEQMYLPGVSNTMHTNHPSVVCDYLPTLREIGRAEQVRLANYTRRANRFFNYLQGLGIHASKSFRDFMSDAFS